jgi:hypothetical protein
MTNWRVYKKLFWSRVLAAGQVLQDIEGIIYPAEVENLSVY